MIGRFSTKVKVIALVFAIAVGYLAFFGGGPQQRTVSAHFSEAISVYKGSEVAIMGVKVGQVTAVVPEGDTVRVDMQYDPKYRLPADVQAVIVTPTLVADRFVQLAPAYGGGATLPNGGSIAADHTHAPIELDQIYGSLSDLTKTLGPNGANQTGALNNLLSAAAAALGGNGQLGHDMLNNFGNAAQTIGDNSNQLFSTIDNLSQLTTTLQQNDAFVSQFFTHLSQVAQQLSGERGDLQQALAAIAGAVGTVQQFIHDNKTAATNDLQELTKTLQVLANQRDTLGQVLQLSALGLNNLTEAYDASTGTIGIRLQLGPMATDLGNVLCGVITVNKMPNAAQACTLLKALLPGTSNIGAGTTPSGSGGTTSAPSGLAAILDPLGRL